MVWLQRYETIERGLRGAAAPPADFQYPDFVGWERRWDSSTEHWIPLDESHDGAECRNSCSSHHAARETDLSAH